MLSKQEFEQIKICLNGVGHYRMHISHETCGEKCIPVSYLFQLLESFTKKEKENKNEK